MEYSKGAPRLKFSEPKDDRCNTNLFYQLPAELMEAVMSGITGNNLNQLKIMVLYLGTKEGFRMSEAYVLDKLKIQKQPYLKARKALMDRGWLRLEKNPYTIVVDLDKIWEDYYKTLREEFSEEDV